jgi:hypothetical protein
MTSAERAQVLQLARELCLEVAKRARRSGKKLQKDMGMRGVPPFIQGEAWGAEACAKAIKAEQKKP